MMWILGLLLVLAVLLFICNRPKSSESQSEVLPASEQIPEKPATESKPEERKPKIDEIIAKADSRRVDADPKTEEDPIRNLEKPISTGPRKEAKQERE